MDKVTAFPQTVESESLEQYLRSEGFGSHHVDGFNYWLFNQIPNTISSRGLIRPAKIGVRNEPEYVRFTNVRVLPPRYTKGNRSYFLTPQMCRNQLATYDFDITLTLEVVVGHPEGQLKLENGHPARIENICIGAVPLLLKSDLCILKGKTRDQLRVLGEDPDDPPGYFIVDGVEKVILLQEQLALNKILILPASPKNAAMARMTINTTRGTTIVDVSRKNQKSSIEIKLPSLKVPAKTGENKKKEPQVVDVMLLYALYGITTIPQIYDMIRRFIPVNQQEKCMAQMCINRVNFIIETNREMDVRQWAFNQLIRKLPNSENLSYEQAMGDIVRIINNDLFPNVEEVLNLDQETMEEFQGRKDMMRLNGLSMMIARYLQFLCKYRPADNRDAWANKRTESAGRLCDLLLRQVWRKLITDIQTAVVESNASLSTIAGKLTGAVTDTFRSSIAGPNWGAKGQNVKQNISQTLERGSPIATYAHIGTVDVGVSRTSVVYTIRAIQPDGRGKLCYVSTPEGNNAGLVKALAMTAKTSLDRNDQEIMAVLNRTAREWLSDHPSPERPDAFVLNGKVLGWVEAESVLQYLLTLRRQGQIFADTGIIYEEGCLTADLGPSRPIRPLYIVNPETQTLVYDDKIRAADSAAAQYNYAVTQYNTIQNQGSDLSGAIAQMNSAYENYYLAQQDDPRRNGNQWMLANGVMEYLSCWEESSARIKLAAYRSRITDRLNRIETAREAHATAVEELVAIQRGQVVQYGDTTLTMKIAQERVADYQRDYQKAQNTMPYTHCELDPIAQLGVSAALIPWAESNQAPRNTYQSSMGKQAIGIYHSNFRNRFDGNKLKVLVDSCAPIVDNPIANLIGLKVKGGCEEPIVAFMAYPENQEDGMLLKLEYLQAGGFRMEEIIVYQVVVQLTGDVVEELKRPTPQDGESEERYRHIQQALGTDDLKINGLPRIGAYLRAGDCVVGKMQFIVATNSTNNDSTFMKVGEEGIVEDVKVCGNGKIIDVAVKMRVTRIPIEGDKFAARNAQKVTIGLVVAAVNLPFSKDGIIADVYINPHAIPSRMTISYPKEIHASKAACIDMGIVNGAVFQPYDIDRFISTLTGAGLDYLGYETCRSGLSGRPLETDVFMGPCAIQSLKHKVWNKIQARGQGQMKSMTRQPTKGRGARGGIRFGEMERDCLISYGASWTIKERLMLDSDVYVTAICATCGTYAINNSAGTGYKKCPMCGHSEFGTIEEPYIYKLMQQLLACMDINLRPGTSTWTDYKKRLFGSATMVQKEDTLAAVQDQLAEDIVEDDVADEDQESNASLDVDEALTDFDQPDEAE